MRLAISLPIMIITICGCSTSRNADEMYGHFTNDTYINSPLGFALRLTEGWTLVPNTEIERAVTRANGCPPAERALLTAVKKDDACSAIMVCLLSTARPEQIFAKKAVKFAHGSATGTVERVNMNGLELLHRQDRLMRDGDAWRSDLYACERPCGTLVILLTQDESKQVCPANKLLREMLTPKIDPQPTHTGNVSIPAR